MKLVVFARAPERGRVKTRLAQTIGEDAALALYVAFLDDTLAIAAEAAREVGARLVVAVAGDPFPTRHAAELVAQADGDLGARMGAVLDGEPTCVIGSDAPTLAPSQIVRAFSMLADHEVVIGPSLDGGYWLIGSRRPVPELMTDMPWSTPRLLDATLDRLAGGSATLVDFFYDVDDADDLARLRRHLAILPAHVAPATRRAILLASSSDVGG